MAELIQMNAELVSCGGRLVCAVVPFYAFDPDVRRLVYTTNAIEALNSKRRGAVRVRGHFPTDEAAMKLLFWS